MTRMIFPNMKQKWLVVDDDNDESCSSLDVDFLKNRVITTAPSSKKKRKSVRFNETRNESYDNIQVCKNELKELCWYNAQDYKYFKDSARLLARQIIRSKEGRAPSSYAKIVGRLHKACCECHTTDPAAAIGDNTSVLTETESILLKERIRTATVRLGIDRLLIREVGLGSRARQWQTKSAVLEMQKSFRDAAIREIQVQLLEEDGCCCFDHSFTESTQSTAILDEDDDTVDSMSEEDIRSVSEAISLPSRLFAREMAQALASTIAEDY